MYIGSLHWLLKSVIQGEERQEIHWLREDHPYTLGGHRSSPLLQEDLLTLWMAALMKSLAGSGKRSNSLPLQDRGRW